MTSALRARLSPFRLVERLTGHPVAGATRVFYKDSALYGAANFLPRILGIFLWPLITRRMATHEYFIFDCFVRALSLLAVLLSLQTESAVARYYYEGREDFPRFLGTLLFFTLALAAVMTGQFWLFRGHWAHWLQLPLPVFTLALIAALALLAHQLYFNLTLARKESGAFFFWSVLKQVIYVGLAVALLLTLKTARYRGLIWANFAAAVVPAAYFIYWLARWMKPAFRRQDLSYALRFALPAVPGALALFIVNFFDRFYIGSRDPNAAGQYSFAYNLAMLIQIMTTGVFSAMMPRFYEHKNKGETAAIQKIFARDFRLFLAVATALILVSRPLALVLGQASYLGCLPIVPSIVTAYLFLNLSQYFGLYIGWRRKFLLLQSLAMILTGLINPLLNVWLIPRWGPLAAGPITLISYLLLWLCYLGISRGLLREETIHFRGLRGWFALYLIFAALWSIWGY